MRIPSLPLIASVALLAAPAFAFAQTPGMTTGQPNGANQRSNQSAMSQNHGMMGNQSYGENQGPNQQSYGQLTQNTQQKLQQSLQRNGFKDVTVQPEAFVIHAQAPDGSRIVMEVTPDQAAGIVVSNNTGNSSQPHNQGMQNGQNGSSNWNQHGTNSSGSSSQPYNEGMQNGQNGPSNWNHKQGGNNH